MLFWLVPANDTIIQGKIHTTPPLNQCLNVKEMLFCKTLLAVNHSSTFTGWRLPKYYAHTCIYICAYIHLHIMCVCVCHNKLPQLSVVIYNCWLSKAIYCVFLILVAAKSLYFVDCIPMVVESQGLLTKCIPACSVLVAKPPVSSALRTRICCLPIFLVPSPTSASTSHIAHRVCGSGPLCWLSCHGILCLQWWCGGVVVLALRAPKIFHVFLLSKNG